MVKVRILKSVGTYLEGQELEVSDEHALAMCTIRKMQQGNALVDYRTAITMEELEKIKAMPVDKGGLTVEEAKALGIPNVVETPKTELDRPFSPFFNESKLDTEANRANIEITKQQAKKKVA